MKNVVPLHLIHMLKNEKYAQPLIMGEVEVPHENGVPAYVRLSKRRVRKVLDSFTFEQS